MARLILAVIAILCAQVASGMELVWIDREGGTSFRHPDTLRAVDPYSRRLVDAAGARRLFQGGDATAAGRPAWGEHEILQFSRVIAADEQRGLPAVVGGILGVEVEPAPEAADGPVLLRCLLGRILVLRHDGRISGVGIGTAIEESAAARVLATFEALVPGATPGAPRATSREAACRTGMLILPDGSLKRNMQVPRATTWEAAIECESRYYQVRGTAPTEEMAALALHLDGLHAALRAWLPLPAEPTVKRQVVVFKTAAEFVAAAGGMVPTGKDGAPGLEGLYVPGVEVAMTFSDRNGHSIGNLRLRASHEAVHQYLHGHARRFPPRFFDEGCAVLFENGTVQGDAYVLSMPEVRLRLLQQSYRQQKTTLAPFTGYLAGKVALGTNHYGECYAMLRVLASVQGKTASSPGLTAAWRVLIGEPEPGAGPGSFTNALLGKYAGTGGGDAALAAWQAEVQRLVGQTAWKEQLRIAIP